jgi:hypothetical protein
MTTIDKTARRELVQLLVIAVNKVSETEKQFARYDAVDATLLSDNTFSLRCRRRGNDAWFRMHVKITHPQ